MDRNARPLHGDQFFLNNFISLGPCFGLRLRTAAQPARFAAEFGQSPTAFFGEVFEELRTAGLLLEEEGGRLVLTARGRLLSDSVFERFV